MERRDQKNHSRQTPTFLFGLAAIELDGHLQAWSDQPRPRGTHSLPLFFFVNPQQPLQKLIIYLSLYTPSSFFPSLNLSLPLSISPSLSQSLSPSLSLSLHPLLPSLTSWR